MKSSSALVVLLAGVAGLAVGLAVSQPAHAQAPRTAECRVVGTLAPKNTTEWMNQQLAAGRTSFVSHTPGVLCAW